MRKIQLCGWKFGEVDGTVMIQLKVDQYLAGWTNECSRTEHKTWNLKNMKDECSPVGHDGFCGKILQTHQLLVTVLNCAHFQQYKLRTCNVAMGRVRATIVAADRQCVLHIVRVSVALGIQHAMRKCHIVTCAMSGSKTLFHILSEPQRLWGGGLLHIKCVLIFSTNFEEFLIMRRIQRHITTHVHRSTCKISVILIRFYWNLNFLDRFSKKIKYQISWKSIQWEPRFFLCGRAEGYDIRDDVNSHFSQFCERA
jgi:hypothetical protein